jgi:hypothetical protein
MLKPAKYYIVGEKLGVCACQRAEELIINIAANLLFTIKLKVYCILKIL